jgi:hypothetical protein
MIRASLSFHKPKPRQYTVSSATGEVLNCNQGAWKYHILAALELQRSSLIEDSEAMLF